MVDYSFIKLYKNDFNSAKLADDTPIVKLPYKGFIVQKPNEYFLQITNSDSDVSFVGAIQVDLINGCGTVKRNINTNFYYEGYVDSNGINQIAFAFGFVGVDFHSEPLYLKITDLTNDNIWYSNNFLVTDSKTSISTRFDYTNKGKIYGISYDLAPYIQSVRLSDCYDQTPANKRDLKQYVNADGKQVNYRSITTFLRKYLINAIDYFVNDRLEVLFSHAIIYVNGQRSVISDFSIDERKGDANYFNGEFTVNPQGAFLETDYQIYEYLKIVNATPINNGIYTVASLPDLTIEFNKPINVTTDFSIKLYKDGALQSITPFTYNVSVNILELFPTYTFVNGSYYFTIEADKVYSNGERLGFTRIDFEVTDGEFDGTEFDNTEFLTN